MHDYRSFLESPLAAQWKRIGARRRAGVLTPLFSLHSEDTIGVGEFQDLKKLADWCVKAGLSVIQLLPLNDVGFHFRPYDSQSSFALEPMHLSLDRIRFVAMEPFIPMIDALRQEFGPRGAYFDTAVKGRKLEILWSMFLVRQNEGTEAFEKFRLENRFWLEPYAQFKVLKHKFWQKSWLDWPEEFRTRRPEALSRLAQEDGLAVEYTEWVQWQASLQMKDAHAHAAKKKVFLMGDLPFLVSRDSADVWANPDYFKLDLSSGAPPDLCFAGGQEWGMPPYRWEAIAADGFRYVSQKLKTAAQYYDLFRIDHFVGVFRVYVFQNGQGTFDPPDENVWEAQGRRIVEVLSAEKKLLPCAEDLGTIPECSARVLKDFAIPGMEIQRWSRDWGKTWDFLSPGSYRLNSIAVISTHDIPSLTEWWETEAGFLDEGVVRAKCGGMGVSFDEVREKLLDQGPRPGRWSWKKDVTGPASIAERLGKPRNETAGFDDLHASTSDERKKFWRAIGMKGEPEPRASAAFVSHALKNASESRSVFSIQLLEDWLALADLRFEGRVNFPGQVLDTNWRQRIPLTLEELGRHPVSELIRSVNSRTERT